MSLIAFAKKKKNKPLVIGNSAAVRHDDDLKFEFEMLKNRRKRYSDKYGARSSRPASNSPSYVISRSLFQVMRT